jgi:NAD(P)-dependent dehydrogenase (short-subunit alcohol dehydrogenase family)
MTPPRPAYVVVNNAGIAESGAAIDLPRDSFDRVIDTNLRGVWAVSTEAAPG